MTLLRKRLALTNRSRLTPHSCKNTNLVRRPVVEALETRCSACCLTPPPIDNLDTWQPSYDAQGTVAELANDVNIQLQSLGIADDAMSQWSNDIRSANPDLAEAPDVADMTTTPVTAITITPSMEPTGDPSAPYTVDQLTTVLNSGAAMAAPAGSPAADKYKDGNVTCGRWPFFSNFHICISKCAGIPSGLYEITNAPGILISKFSCSEFSGEDGAAIA